MPSVNQFHRSLTSLESYNQSKWGKPAFQAFQLRPWNKDFERVEPTNHTLGIFGPQSQVEMSRAKSVPVRHNIDSLVDRDEERTAHSVANMCDTMSLKSKSSLEALPNRPPLSKIKQIPGRYFPKPVNVETDGVSHNNFTGFRRMYHPKNNSTIRVRNSERPSGNSKSMNMSDLPHESISFLDVMPKSNRQKSPGFNRLFHRMKTNYTEFPEIRSEVFAICFNPNDSSRKGGEQVNVTNDNNNNNNITNNNNNINTTTGSNAALKSSNLPSCDPNSELRSDYYTIKRISVSSKSTRAPNRSFSVVLRGQPKRLHPKTLNFGGYEFDDSNNNNNIHHYHHHSHQAKGSYKSGSGGSLAGGSNAKDVVDSCERQTDSHKPIEITTTKIKVKIDSNTALGPIMINGFS